MLLGWCDETAGSIAAKDLAYDIADGSLPLASTGRFPIAGRLSISRRRVIGACSIRCDGSRLSVRAGWPQAYERPLLVKTGTSGRLVVCSSAGTVVRMIHGKSNCADPCRIRLSQMFERTSLIDCIDRGQSKSIVKTERRQTIRCRRDGRVQGAGAGTIEDNRLRLGPARAGSEAGWSATIQTIYQDVGQNGEDERVEAAAVVVEVQERQIRRQPMVHARMCSASTVLCGRHARDARGQSGGVNRGIRQ